MDEKNLVVDSDETEAKLVDIERLMDALAMLKNL